MGTSKAKFTEFELSFIKDLYLIKKLEQSEVIEMCNKKFNHKYTYSQIQHLLRKLDNRGGHSWKKEHDDFLLLNCSNCFRPELLDKFNKHFKTNISVNSLSARLVRIGGHCKKKEWLPEHIELLRKEYPRHSAKQMVDLLKEIYGVNYTEDAVISRAGIIGVKSVFYTTPEQEDFVREYYPIMSTIDFTKKYNDTFGTNKSCHSIKALAARLNVKSELNQLEKRKQFIIDNYNKYDDFNQLTDALNKEFGTNFCYAGVNRLAIKLGVHKITRKPHTWTSEQEQFLRDNYARDINIVDSFNETFGTNITEGAIRAKLCALNVKLPKTKTEDALQFIKDNYERCERNQTLLTELLNEHFGVNLTHGAIHLWCKELNLPTDVKDNDKCYIVHSCNSFKGKKKKTPYKVRRIPSEEFETFSEDIKHEIYVHRYSKANDYKTRKYIPIRESDYTWIMAGRKIPEGHHIAHLDGNSLNDDLNNLVCITYADFGRVSKINGGRSWSLFPVGFNETCIELAKLKDKVTRRN